MKISLLSITRALYKHLPLPQEFRLWLKAFFFTAAAPLIRDTPLYRNWNAEQRRSVRRGLLSIQASGAEKTRRDVSKFQLRRVSAIVPNYNYARYLEQRFESIVSQTYAPAELIVIDDASTDDSVPVIRKTLEGSRVECRIMVNERNSGSVFDQWQKGVELSKGDFIWMCEADDYADSCFLEHVMPMFDDPSVVMGYAQSCIIDASGAMLEYDCLDSTDEVDIRKWLKDYVCNGAVELATALSIKNTIPNASAVVFRKEALRRTLRECGDELKKMKVAGDWLVYANMLRRGRIGFIAKSLNAHRRHKSSVSTASSNTRQMAEIIFMQERVARFVPVSRKNRAKADRYAREVCRYLGIDLGDAGHPARHPDVSRWLDVLRGNASPGAA